MRGIPFITELWKHPDIQGVSLTVKSTDYARLRESPCTIEFIFEEHTYEFKVDISQRFF